MDKKAQKILIVVVVAGIGLYLLLQRQQYNNQYGASTMYGDIINAALSGLTNATNSIIQTSQQEKRANAQQKYDMLRDTKDNSALFSNDILITGNL